MHDFSSQPDEDSQPPPIPEVLYSDFTEEPFAECTRCNQSLSDCPGGYQVSKMWRRNECVFEYVLCDDCRRGLMEEFSKESKQRLQQYEREHVSFDGGLEQCSVCGVRRDAETTQDFVLTGIMEGRGYHGGLMVCGTCGERAQELLSSHTKDTWRRFRDENFDGPPGDEVFDLPAREEKTTRAPKPVLV